ncbi:MAG: ribosome biogenesis GTPase Der [Myxococcales bacterium]|nr:ribosome biogenesis GTPase Der [Myxococcales bacterium]
MTATIALVGRPNVGKSTLFNRMVGGRPALVHDTPGLTRDRRYGEFEYFGAVVRVIDTGGLDPAAEGDVIGRGIHRQAWRAIDEADALVLVVDGAAGLAPLDAEVARVIRATGKPVVLAVNKIDSPKRDVEVADFYSLGLGEPFAVSSAHGRGFDRLLEQIVSVLGLTAPAPAVAAPAPDDDAVEGDDEVEDDEDDEDVLEDDEDAAEDEDAPAPARVTRRRRPHRADADAGPVRIALLGKPNAGKSSLCNRLLGEERSLVHHQPGTTTDPVDTPLSFAGHDYILVDTAGIRRKARVEADVEKLAVTMALGQIERADVVVLVIDAAVGPSEQDARLAGAAEEAGKALVIALNKSDLVRGSGAAEAVRAATADNFHFVTWAPTVMVSAERGDGVDRLMDAVAKVAAQHGRRITTSELNRFFAEVCETVPPPIWRGKSVRIYYLTQAAVAPPTFVLKVSAVGGVSPAYRRFLANQLRKRYGFKGTPIRVFTRAKDSRGDNDRA